MESQAPCNDGIRETGNVFLIFDGVIRVVFQLKSVWGRFELILFFPFLLSCIGSLFTCFSRPSCTTCVFVTQIECRIPLHLNADKNTTCHISVLNSTGMYQYQRNTPAGVTAPGEPLKKSRYLSLGSVSFLGLGA